MNDITTYVQLAFALIMAIITYIIAPYVKARINDIQRVTLRDWIDTAVRAAEQTIKGDNKGTERKRYVLAWLEANNITVDSIKIDAMIENAVFVMKNEIL